MQSLKNLALILTIATTAAAASAMTYADGIPDGDGGVTFSPGAGVEASLVVSGPQVLLKVTGKQGESEETIAVETEKKLKVSIEDYNFDGHKDFAISHLDDGMGTYQIYQVYVYSAKAGKFLPLAPKCGDEFINLAVNKAKRTLTNSYMVENKYKTCQMKF